MDTITIEVEVGHDHRLVDALPPEVPVGRVRLVIEPIEAAPTLSKQPLSREEARRLWTAAGKMLTQRLTPESVVESNEAEDSRLANLFGQGISLDQLIDEDRGPRE
ncbi:MAG: hypothetical protein ABI947_10580 [Chloroflexota bacterium]